MSHDHDDFAFEPIPGLPEKLPDGERILWQGAPQWRELAVRAFHVRAVLLYFGALMVWRGAAVIDRGGDAGQALTAATSLIPLAAAAVGLLSLAAWMSARAALYTITNRRVVMRMGVALTKTINIPFQVIANASVAHGAGQYGDLALELTKDNRIAFLHLWPHVRPWHVNHPQPALRTIPNVEAAAGVLKSAMLAWQVETGQPVAHQPRAAEPAGAEERNFVPGNPAGLAA